MRAQGHGISRIFADVGSTKSFSLSALFSVRKSDSVTALQARIKVVSGALSGLRALKRHGNSHNFYFIYYFTT